MVEHRMGGTELNRRRSCRERRRGTASVHRRLVSETEEPRDSELVLGSLREAPPKAKGGKMQALINWRLKITLNDGRALVGQMLAFDRHMNLVVVDCEEFRRIRTKKKAEDGEPVIPQEQKRTLGLVIIRGEVVVSISVEGPPPVPDEDKTPSALLPGPGRGMPAGRGMGMMPPVGLAPPRPFGAPPMGMPPGMPPPGFRPPGFPGGPPPGFPGMPMGGPPPPGFPPQQ
ncbi:hypothetical protein BS47DRAFT_1482995 [Hydnum rufescens UP504]|uniref:Sm protein B n=1 Tax=Hydnum rufescens UP504 TaxID=1448309 RepID=A0A9P6B5I0_9AGAM|nr:hypothetical protein BS47DRAFT_1482995 [Hydnum rufescens UP504]